MANMNRFIAVTMLLAGAQSIELQFGFGDIGALTGDVMDVTASVVPGEAGEFLDSTSATTTGLIDSAVDGDVTGVVDATGTLSADSLEAAGLDDIAYETEQWTTVASDTTDAALTGTTTDALNTLVDGGQYHADRIDENGIGTGSASADEVATGSTDCELLGGTLNLWSDGNYYCTSEPVV